MEKNVERLLVGADQVMRFIADDLTNDPETFDFQVWIRRSISLAEVANQISFYSVQQADQSSIPIGGAVGKTCDGIYEPAVAATFGPAAPPGGDRPRRHRSYVFE